MPPCGTCGGHGTVSAGGKSVPCPACGGSGEVGTTGRPGGDR